MRLFSKRQKNLSFGIDCGEKTVKLVGLRMLGCKFELTHCLLFELPEASDTTQIWKFVSKKLNKINFYSGSVSINLPSENITFKLRKKKLPLLKNLIRKSGKTDNRPDVRNLTGSVAEDVVKNDWKQRINLVNEPVKFQIEDFSLPYLENIFAEECRIYLHIGEQNCRITLAKNHQILDHQKIDFSLEKIVPDSFSNLTLRKKAFSILRSAQIQFVKGKCRWQTKYSIKKMDELFENVEKNLLSFSEKLSKILENYEKTFSVKSPKAGIIGAGGLYPWLEIFLKKELNLTFRKIKPFSKMDKIGNNFSSGKLEEVEPVFAEAVALAVSGALSNRETRYVTNKINWIFEKEWFFKSKFRLVSLTFAFLSLLFYLISAFQMDQKYQEYQTLNLQFQDMERQIGAFNHRVGLDSLLTGLKVENSLEQKAPKFSNILKLIGEEIPSGNWVTHLRLIPASKIKEFRTKNRRKSNSDLAIIINGKAISSNFISDFYNKLNESGCFSKVLVKRSGGRGIYIDSIPYIIYAKISSKDE